MTSDPQYPAKHGTNYTNEEPVGAVDFFSNFGKYERERARKRQQLANDYLEFKRKEEENFNKRFKNRKRETEMNTKLPELPPTSNIQTTPQTENRLESKLNSLERLITNLQNDLYQGFQWIPTTANDTNRGNHNGVDDDLVQDPSYIIDNNATLPQHMEQLKLAEDRLASVEMEYNKTKAMCGLANSYTPIIPKASTLKFETEHNRNQIQIKKGDQEDRLVQQRQYRLDLEAQMRDNEARKRKEKLENEKFDRCNEHTNNVLRSEKIHTEESKPNITQSSLTEIDAEYSATGLNNLITLPHGSTTIRRNEATNDANSQCLTVTPPSNKPEKQFAKARYAEELKKQMEESRARKELQKKIDEEYDRKFEQNINNAPVKFNENENNANPSTQDNLDNTINVKPNFSRGGHGIFGNPLSEAQKTGLSQYKEELAKQIAEKQRLLEVQRQKELELEHRDAERLKMEQMKIQQEYEREKLHRERRPTEENSITTHGAVTTVSVVPAKSPLAVNTQQQNQHKQSQINEKYIQKLKTKQVEESGLHVQNIFTNSPEPLIETKSHPDNWKIESSKNEKRDDTRTQVILKQLDELRRTLIKEKSRIESSLNKQSSKMHCTIGSDLVSWGKPKPHPRVDRKATNLFKDIMDEDLNNPSVNDNEPSLEELNIIANPNKLQWNNNASTEIDQKQRAILKAQDDCLKRLKSELRKKGDKYDLTKLTFSSERLTEEKRKTSLLASDSVFLSHQNKSDTTLKTNVTTDGYIDLNMLTEKNMQRKKRLDALQMREGKMLS